MYSTGLSMANLLDVQYCVRVSERNQRCSGGIGSLMGLIINEPKEFCTLQDSFHDMTARGRPDDPKQRGRRRRGGGRAVLFILTISILCGGKTAAIFADVCFRCKKFRSPSLLTP